MGAASLLVALALSAEHGFASASVQAELRAGAPLAGNAALVPPELSVRPSLDAGLQAGVLRAEVGYHPQLTLTGFTSPPGFLHRVQASLDWRRSASSRVQVDQALTFGQYDTSLGNLGAGGALVPVILPLTTVEYITSNTTAGMDGAIAPRLRLRTGLGYNASGGLTEVAQQAIPLQHGPRFTVELQHASTRRDALSTQLRLSADRFSNGRTSAIGEGGVSWRRILTREMGLQLGAGAAAVASVGPGEAPVPSAVPTASANLTYGVPRLRFSLDASYSPQADALSGLIFQRAGVGGSAEYRPRSDYTVRASFGGSWSVAGQNAGDRALLGEVSVAYRERPLEISAGVRVADASISDPSTPGDRDNATELRAFVAFSYEAALVR